MTVIQVLFSLKSTELKWPVSVHWSALFSVSIVTDNEVNLILSHTHLNYLLYWKRILPKRYRYSLMFKANDCLQKSFPTRQLCNHSLATRARLMDCSAYEWGFTHSDTVSKGLGEGWYLLYHLPETRLTWLKVRRRSESLYLLNISKPR